MADRRYASTWATTLSAALAAALFSSAALSQVPMSSTNEEPLPDENAPAEGSGNWWQFTLPQWSLGMTPKDPGFFFGIQGGVNSLEKGSFGTSYQTPAVPLDCEIVVPGGLPPLPGLAVGGACVLGTPVAGTGIPAGAAQQSFDAKFKNGETYGLSFGYSYASGFRPEFSLNYRSNDIESIRFVEGYPTPGSATPVNGSTSTAPTLLGSTEAYDVTASLWFDFYNDTQFVPYIGAGLGYSSVKVEGIGNPATTTAGTVIDDKDNSMSVTVGLGIGYKVTDNLMASLDLRYLNTRALEFDNPNAPITGAVSSWNPSYRSDYNASSASLSLRYFPKDYALGRADTDGDGVPDDDDKCPDTPQGVSVSADGCPVDSDGDGVPDYLDKCPGTAAGVTVNADGCALDADGDGTPDSQDKCPGTPSGIAVGPDGCPLDSDNDGVPDYLDKCPNTAPGALVDADGCEADTDGDGVPDRLDKCPESEPGMKVGTDGCPLDSDGDGVPDYMDECPRTPAGAKVLANGCALKDDCRTPRPGEEVDENGCALDQSFILRGVNFEFDSDRLTPEAKEILKQVAQTLKAYPDVNTEIAGHTDNLGTDAYNLTLSEKRSISVKNFLTTEGVEAGRMSPTGYGESQPIDTNETEEGQSKNRRVELRVIEEESAVRE